jgi:hypothetical protein
VTHPADEAPRDPVADGTDAITFAFGDPDAGVFGMARAGLTADGASGLAVLFDGDVPVTARAEGGAAPAERRWEDIDIAGVRTTVLEPLQAWTVSFDDGEGRGFDLEVRAASHPGDVPEDAPAARAGGMAGYDHLCAVGGEVRTGARTVRVACTGQRSRLWGAPDWNRLELTRSVGVWLDGGDGATLTAVRPAGVRGHDEEAVSATFFTDGPPAVALPVGDPRLSTATDAEGRQRRAGLELWVDQDDWPHRAAGEVLCGTSLDLGRLRLDCAFLHWRMEGREGIGRYDVLRRVG